MKRLIALCGVLALSTAGTVCAKLPPPSKQQMDSAAAARTRVQAEAKKQAEALARAQDRVVAHYRRSKGLDAGSRRLEKLACFTGNEDRHARIGVELVNQKVAYFAYYSKWKPRTCSIEARRGGPYDRWTDSGDTSTVSLVDQKGMLMIERKGNSYRFVFRNVDRMRYCGMDGKINGSLTVTAGRNACTVQGVMDGHEG
jgi:hypothetical protein